MASAKAQPARSISGGKGAGRTAGRKASVNGSKHVGIAQRKRHRGDMAASAGGIENGTGGNIRIREHAYQAAQNKTTGGVAQKKRKNGRRAFARNSGVGAPRLGGAWRRNLKRRSAAKTLCMTQQSAKSISIMASKASANNG
jgi:hypothetical protein